MSKPDPEGQSQSQTSNAQTKITPTKAKAKPTTLKAKSILDIHTFIHSFVVFKKKVDYHGPPTVSHSRPFFASV